jgi:hypothetical protein
VLRELVDDQRGRAEGEHRAEQREEPQYGAAIDHQQDEDDDQAGGEQQSAVDTAERVDERHQQAAGSGTVDDQAVGRIGLGRLDDVLLDLDQLVALDADVAFLADQRDGDGGGGVVARRIARRRNLVGGNALDGLEGLYVRSDLRLVGVSQSAVALVDDEPGYGLHRAELVRRLVDLRRLGGGGQIGSVVVLLNPTQFALERAAGQAEQQPEDRQPTDDPYRDRLALLRLPRLLGQLGRFWRLSAGHYPSRWSGWHGGFNRNCSVEPFASPARRASRQRRGYVMALTSVRTRVRPPARARGVASTR